ncbi:hypothetical protein MB02_01130 [Croceicoccus estronivorus]|uniref:phospholipase D family protein n=1 Tax=Croceicoccus estronivorus TaxID=1172626 RepID=UPI0008294EE2|nr:phospholipase D family protein [Croceicoccus estronivorus]OCC25306.1 hypothetical protein MB02_01130 [Croceicoccus estronivorus]
MIFLNEVEALAKIQAMLVATKKARLSVAFWGDGAVELLGLDRPDLDLKIVCNLDSGACNPAELRKLLAVVGQGNLLSNPRLHAKVYWTPEKACIGSSNASTNGLAVEGTNLTGWSEANIQVSDRNLIKEIEDWFDNQASPENAYEIDEAAIKRAEVVWRRRSRSAPPGVPLNRNLLSAFRAAPNHPAWNSVRVLLWSDDIDEDGRNEEEQAKNAGWVPRDYDCYQGWGNAFRSGEYLIEFDLSSDKAKYTSIYQVPSPMLASETLCFVRHIGNSIFLPAFGKLRFGKQDQAEIATIARDLLSNDRNKIFDLQTIVSQIDVAAKKAAPSIADPKAFEAELRRTAMEAQKLGYNPTGFFELINRLGAVAAARKLLQTNAPSNGFVRLWEMKRTDLTVEHIALEEPWSSLFDENELREARRRLGRELR